jgi:DNA-binding IclR family transcriptional regulator
MAGNSGEPGRTVSSKVAALLTAFTTGNEHTASTLAGQTDLPVSTVHRLVTDLARSPLVERTDHRTYRPGPGLRGLAATATEPTLRERGPLIVDDLSASLQTTVRLGVLDELDVAYIEKRPGPTPGTLFPNTARLPAHATALGKALLAAAPPALVQILIRNGLARYTPRTLTCPDQLRIALAQTRRRGYAVADEELHPSTHTVAMLVRDHTGDALAAIEVHLPRLSTHNLAHALPALTLATRGLSRELAPDKRQDRPPHPLAVQPGWTAQVGSR